MSKTSKTAYAILGMLTIEPMSGYDIRQLMQKSTAHFWSESDGQLYPALANLTELEWITCKLAKKNTRDKKIYSITKKGRTELKKWLTEEALTFSVRDEFLLKLFFGANIAPRINAEHIAARRYQVKSSIAQLKATKDYLMQEEKNSPHLTYWLMSLDYGIKLAQAKLAWCDEVINKLNVE